MAISYCNGPHQDQICNNPSALCIFSIVRQKSDSAGGGGGARGVSKLVFYAQSTGTVVSGRSKEGVGGWVEMNMIRRGAAVVALSEISLNSGLKGGHR